MSSQQDSSSIPFGKVKEYSDANIPIVPLYANGDPDTRNIFTKEELNTLPLKLPEDLRKLVWNDGVRLLKLLALQPQNPKEFWTEDRIRKQEWKGIACQTGFIASFSAIVAGVDADDPKTRSIIEKRIEEFCLADKTIIQDTPHGGKHLIFKIPIGPDKNFIEQVDFWGKRSLRPNMCKESCIMEIKMQTMQITLDPTKHRIDRHLTYTKGSNVIAIAELPMFYDLLISDMKAQGCLEYTPDEYNANREKDSQNDFIKSFDLKAERYNLADVEIRAGIDIILGRDEENVKENSPFKSIYVLHHRHDTIIALGGYLFWNYITLESAKLFIEKLEKAAGDSSEDIRKSLKKVEETYRRGLAGQRVIGKSGLIDAFTKFHKDKNKPLAEQRLNKLTEALKLRRNKPKVKNNDGIGRINEADTLVSVAEKEIPFTFVNHLNQPCAVVKVRNHYEVMEMNDESFLGLLRQMWRDSNTAKNSLKITISDDMLKRARAALVGSVQQLERPKIKTHLRVAWKERNKVLRYDLTNQSWQQIEISSNGIRLIDSKTILDEIKEYESSGFAKNKAPILFQRYSNTQEQVLPAEKFRSDILDYYIEELTNVTDKRATSFAKRYTEHWRTEGSLDNRTKILIAKVLLISKFIADIPHFLVNVIGSPGAMKTHYLKFDKRLIDPGSTEVHSPPITTKDIHQKFAHNYYIILDNIGFIEKWLSDLVCSVITGSGFECRALWTDQGIVNMVLKSCIAVGSVNRVFNEQDALTRLVIQEFLEVDSNESNYLPEDVIEAKFQEIRPEILSCIFHILSKAIEIKQKITGKYALGRMADVLEWCEAISQAMGYEEMEFRRAYDNLALIQQKHAAKSDPLVVIYLKLFYDIFEDPETDQYYQREREDGYKIFSYNELQEKLDYLAESEGYKTTGKENKLWPKDSQQLAERSREVSSRLRRTSNVALEIRKGRDRSNEFILGTTWGVENYLQNCEDDERKVENFRRVVVDKCIQILKEHHTSQSVEELFKIACERNGEIAAFVGEKFTLRGNWKLRSIVDMIRRRPGVLTISEKPLIFKWLQTDEDSHHPECRYEVHDTCEAKYTHPPLFFGTNKKSEPPEKKNVIPNYEELCVQNNSPTSLTPHNKSSLTPSVVTAITLPILQQPIIISDQLQNPKHVVTSEVISRPIITESAQKVGLSGLLSVPDTLIQTVPELGRFAVFDCEWYRDDLKENQIKGQAGNLYAFCLVDNHGNTTRLHLNQFNKDRRAFMSAIIDAIEQYDTLAGFAIFSDKDFVTDIDHIKINCDQVGLLERFSIVKSRIKLLDIKKIFSNNTVKGFLKAADKVVYREESLDAIARTYVGQGKSEDISGINAEFLQPGEQLEYCLTDAQLCYKILQKKDFELLQIMHEISQEIKLPFFETCNAGYSTEWWRSKLASIDYQKVPRHIQEWIDENMTYNDRKRPKKKTGVKYLGGHVIPPKMGRHLNAVSYDVSSMYPTMANIHNISSETINCSCCKDDMEARVPDQVMRDINEYLAEKAKRPWHYWICQKKRGQFAEIMKDLVERKIQYKEAGLKLKEKAVKILANSGYGCFGNAYFEYPDPRVAELITAFGQYTLKSLEQFVGKEKVLYGDTDSIYFVGANNGIIEIAKSRFGVKLEVDNTWKILFLTSNKKQYVGLTQDGEVVHTTLTGMKSNQPSYYNEVAQKLISKEFLQSFIDTPEDALEKVLIYLRSAILELDIRHNLEKLSFSLESKEPLYAYENNCIQRQIYNEILEDFNGDIDLAKSKSQAGSVYRYWKVVAKNKSATIHAERYQLDIKKYRHGLFNCIRPELEVYGMNENKIMQLEDELVNN
jgi:DNA polymerase elongation subunit (family B)